MLERKHEKTAVTTRKKGDEDQLFSRYISQLGTFLDPPTPAPDSGMADASFWKGPQARSLALPILEDKTRPKESRGISKLLAELELGPVWPWVCRGCSPRLPAASQPDPLCRAQAAREGASTRPRRRDRAVGTKARPIMSATDLFKSAQQDVAMAKIL